MRRNKFLAIIGSALVLSLCLLEGKAQSNDLPKYEVGVQFTALTEPSFDGGRTEQGLGGRFTFNLNRSVALEAEGNYFPHRCFNCGRGPFGDSNGNIAQGLFGVKVGKRFQKWGIFAKGRPGVVSFSQGNSGYVSTGGGGTFPFELMHKRLTNFAVDAGGVLEFYPSKRIVTRFDAGDTLIRYGRRQTNLLTLDSSGAVILFPYTLRAETRHNFQFSAGVGFRF
ncbi:MAG: hypothetical protein JWM21_1818 [Acidobacteria bacterium]|nr:hypothetical protein [Acidobacteriota bacterium]